mmetsp:Transcript_21916/g.40880  ORF Transcript_21916/g.40880 Transcript_21916/m.40880 type:complete len:587 (-) Transcript_21916:347-2107(-)|eukprot:CAMPEP_0197439506 /NCGR_PEP_ID=MMETSP1175-20131217/6226_1 /TAXON_ID=1003142 /ORGANISM="Triceratium dubium, Strain CCMP147" /LENGTH=586 /DNA_ID=CAMNT_0042969433 /DNA_START=127 /DNA_END=1887 /DNA_ORIENTATION=+
MPGVEERTSHSTATDEPNLVSESASSPTLPSSGTEDDAATDSWDTDDETPRAVQIISVGNETNQYAFTFHEERLNSVLTKIPPGWKVSVISVVGAFRTGKSFLLSWFLTYLSHHSKGAGKSDAKEDKIESEGGKWYEKIQSLGNDGFDWRGGAERNTTGIWMWSHPSFLRRSNPETGEDEDIAVLLVDTQGMFDHETTMSLTASIFGLSTLLSSYQIYNVDKRIQEDNLQQLALFSEYGRMALQEDAQKKSKARPSTHKPFQRIEFLVRDWQNFEDDEDVDGMESEMDDYLQKVIADRDAADLKDTRSQITSCFDKVSCFLLCHPGFAVTKKKYAGEVGMIEPTFLRLLDRYCERVFNGGENLVPKAIHGRELTAVELGAYIKAYAKMFENGARFPKATTMLEATSSANNTNATNMSVGKYKHVMDKVAGPQCSSYLKPRELEEMHQRVVNECIEMFDSMANFGDRERIALARKITLQKINEDFEVYNKLNDGRNPIAGFETYLIPMTIAVLSFILRWIADSTCSSWSQTCRAGSDMLSHIYSVVFFFLMIVGTTKTKQIMDALGRFKAAVTALSGVNNDGKSKVD